MPQIESVDEFEKYLSPKEAGRRLNLNPKTVINLIKRGDIEANKFGKQYRILEIEVERYRRETLT